MVVKCMACGHEAACAGVVAPENEVLRCDECGARMSFGRLMPRFIVEPHEEGGRRWLRIRVQHHVTPDDEHILDLDAQYAASLAKNILSLVIP